MTAQNRAVYGCPSTEARLLPLSPQSIVVLIMAFAWQCPLAGAQQTTTSAAAVTSPLNAEEVVQNMVSMNLDRFRALYGYQVTETYRLEYQGLLGTRSANMALDATYKSPGTVTFAVRSATGSRVIINKVFRKLLQAEQEALGEDAKRQAALDNDNYDFSFAGYESSPSGSVYVLRVEPKRKDRFLIRGRIWVDAKDFAVVRIEAAPAKSLSFWVRSTEFKRLYRHVGDFWLPANNHSISRIRLGGTATLTIQYSNYVITSSGQ